MPEDRRPPSSVWPALALAALVGVMVAGWWGFPYFQAWMTHNDCVASGRTAC